MPQVSSNQTRILCRILWQGFSCWPKRCTYSTVAI